MKIIFSTFVLAACTAHTLYAQSVPVTPNTIWFSAEGSHYFINTGFPAHTGIAWYSEQWGGRQLKTSTVDGQGVLRLQAPATFQPAFAISQPERGGTGTVVFMDAPEFTLNEVKADMGAGSIGIDWSAMVAPGTPIVFEVLKASSGEACKVVGSYHATQAGTFQSFTFTDQHALGSTYRLRVRNEAAGERYLTRALLQRGANEAVAIYPTHAHDVIAIAGATGAHYSIIAGDGKVTAEGTLQSGLQTLPISNLASGSYIVRVLNGDRVTTAKITKE